MGVPKFFRWLSERYPKINQPLHCVPVHDIPESKDQNEQNAYDLKQDEQDDEFEKTETLQTSSICTYQARYSAADGYIPVEFDRLYLDMNGILHGCSHSNGAVDDFMTEEEKLKYICYYLDRIVEDIAQPKEVLFCAIDGVAPRAKMNQQRSRRYRNGKESEIAAGLELLKQATAGENDDKPNGLRVSGDGRYSGTMEVGEDQELQQMEEDDEERFHSNAITPGTKFLSNIAQGIQKHIHKKLESEHPKWTRLKIIFSGPNVPGEGEHKIMDYIREQRQLPGYNPNTRHCLMGQDADLIMLALATHEPHFCLLRERVLFGKERDKLKNTEIRDLARAYVTNPDFELLHLNILREYLALEFQTSNVNEFSVYDLERTIDDFVFMTFLIGNDFVPPIPALDIADHAFDILFRHYKKLRHSWSRKLRRARFYQSLGSAQGTPYENMEDVSDDDQDEEQTGNQDPYLTQGGKILDPKRLEFFLRRIGNHEDAFLEEKKKGEAQLNERIRKGIKKFGTEKANSIPTLTEAELLQVQHLKAQKYKQMIEETILRQQKVQEKSSKSYFRPVTSSGRLPGIRSRKPRKSRGFKKEDDFLLYEEQKELHLEAEEQVTKPPLLEHLWGLLRLSISSNGSTNSANINTSTTEPKTNQLEDQNATNDAINSSSQRILGSGGRRRHRSKSMDNSASHLLRNGSRLRHGYSGGGIGPLSQSSNRRPDRDRTETPTEEDLKGQYYYDKFGFTPLDMDAHIQLRRSYLEGLVWCLEYYYGGCCSWSWYYPYHYGPMFSDLRNVEKHLDHIKFDMGEPLRPFDQLLACMPPSSANQLPKSYQWLITSKDSPLIEYYPTDFTIDMNGKRYPWEAVVLLPFLDAEKLVRTTRKLVPESMLTSDEKRLNSQEQPYVLSRENGVIYKRPFKHSTDPRPRLVPVLLNGLIHPMEGFPTICNAPLERLLRFQSFVNVFGSPSQYISLMLKMELPLPSMPPLTVLSSKLIGRTVYINFPHLTEAYVTGISDSTGIFRGTVMNDGEISTVPHIWTKEESTRWHRLNGALQLLYKQGNGTPGGGGWMLPESNAILSVRPVSRVWNDPVDNKLKKEYAQFELQVVMSAALWSPAVPSKKVTAAIPVLEGDPFKYGEDLETTLALPSLTKLVKKVLKSEDYRRRIVSFSHSTYQEVSAYSFSSRNSRQKRRESGAAFSTLAPSDVTTKYDQSQLKGYPSPPDISQRKHFSSNIINPHGLLPGRDATFSLATHSRLTRPKAIEIPGKHLSSLSLAKQKDFYARRMGTRGTVVMFAVGLLSFATYTNADHILTSNYHWPHKLGIRSADSNIAPVLDKDIFFSTEAKRNYEIAVPRGGASSLDMTESSLTNSNPYSSTSLTPPLDFAHGTTTLSFIFRDGIVAAVDSRASIGQFVGSKTVQKVLPIHGNMLGTMAGGAADCSFWIRKLRSVAKLHELEQEGKAMSVARASSWLSHMLYQNRGLQLSVGTMIMGVDKHSGEKSIYYVDQEGTRLKGEMFAVGSGSTFALGILDTESTPESRMEMIEDEAVVLAVRAIRHATYRDAYSGGYIGVYVIKQDGWKKVFSQDLALVNLERED